MATEIVIPFFNGHQHIDQLISTIPEYFDILIVDDQSDDPLENRWPNRKVRVKRLNEKGYFSGAVNFGFINTGNNDVLVLNQDTWFDGNGWEHVLERNSRCGMVGERIKGTHPSFGALGYIHGTFAWFNRDAIRVVGKFNQKEYPLWGSTAEYQWRVARAGFKVLPLKEIPGFHHARSKEERYGSSIKYLLDKTPTKEKYRLIQTPPLLSIIVLCHNYGRFLQDCINSLIGGKTSLGMLKPQTMQSFEIIIVDDASTDDSPETIQKITDISKGIRSFRLQKNVGTARALNFGIEKAVGKYITFLSADDMREDFSLEKLVEVCEQNPHSFAYDDVWLVNKHQKIKQWKIEEYNFEKLIWKNQIHAGIVFPKKAWEDVGGYPAVMNDGREDWAFNVALGIKGWCGIHVHQFGYLYRREGQNRTETNTTEEHRKVFLEKIMGVFPNIYKGDRPVACCGKGGNTKVVSKSTSNFTTGGSPSMALRIGSEGMVKIEYTGKQMSSTWTGDVTAAPYTFGVEQARGWVDKRDVGERGSRQGFLSKKDKNGQWIFKQAASSKETAQNGSTQNEIEAVEIVGDQPVEEVEIKEEETKIELNPDEMTVDQIKALELSEEDWQKLYEKELSGRRRGSALTFLEKLLADFKVVKSSES